MKMLQITFISLGIALLFSSCKSNKSGMKKGAELKRDEALSYLMGNEKKYWQLDEGHDYYEYIQLEKAGKAIGPGGKDFTYSINNDEIQLRDFINTTFKIVEIDNDQLVVTNTEGHKLTYLNIVPGSKLEKEKPIQAVNAKWLKGKHGTSWKFSEGGKIYSYMNNGNIIEAGTLRKIANWRLEGTTLYFGDNKCVVSRLNPVFFDYDAMGIPVTMNYYSEAAEDGNPVKH